LEVGFTLLPVIADLFSEHFSQFIANLNSEFPYPRDTDSLAMLLMAIDGKKQIGDKPAEYLGHQPIRASGDTGCEERSLAMNDHQYTGIRRQWLRFR
jgi:hypothetical protein